MNMLSANCTKFTIGLLTDLAICQRRQSLFLVADVGAASVSPLENFTVFPSRMTAIDPASQDVEIYLGKTTLSGHLRKSLLSLLPMQPTGPSWFNSVKRP